MKKINQKVKIKTLLSAYDNLDRLTLLQLLKVITKELAKAQPLLSKVNEGNNISIDYDEEGNVKISATGDLSVDWNDIANIPTTLLYKDQDNTIVGAYTFKNVGGIKIYDSESGNKHVSIHADHIMVVNDQLQAHTVYYPSTTGHLATIEEIDIELNALDQRVESLEDSVSDLDTYKATKEIETVLWENDSPSIDFAETDISIPTIATYKKVLIVCKTYKSDNDYIINELDISKYNITACTFVANDSGYLYYRKTYITKNITTVHISNSFYIPTPNNEINLSDNGRLIPVKIIGIKDIDIPSKTNIEEKEAK